MLSVSSRPLWSILSVRRDVHSLDHVIFSNPSCVNPTLLSLCEPRSPVVRCSRSARRLRSSPPPTRPAGLRRRPDGTVATKADWNPPLRPASDAGERAIQRMKVPAGLKISLWAAEPMLANPVAFCFDEKGRFYVAETFRLPRRRHRHPRPHELARRRPRLPHRRRPRRHVSASSEGRKFEATTSAGSRPHPPARGHRRRRQGRQVDRLRRRLQPHRGRPRRRRARAPRQRLVHLHPRPLAAHATPRATARPTSSSRCTPATASTSRFLGHDLHGLRHRARRQALLHHRRPRPQREDAGRPAVVQNPTCGAVLRCDPDGTEPRVVRHRPAQPAGAGLRRVRQPLHRRQQLRRRRPGPLGLRRRGRRQRLARSATSTAAPRPTAARGTPRSSGTRQANGQRRLHRAAARPHRQRPVGPDLLPRHRPARSSTTTTSSSCDFRGSAGGSGIRAFAVKPKGAGFEVADAEAVHLEQSWPPTATSAPTAALRQRLGRRLGPTDARAASTASRPGAGRRPAGRGDEEADRRGHGQAAGRRAGQAAGAHATCACGRRRSSRWRRRGRRRSRRSTRSRRRPDRSSLPRLHAIWGLGQIGRQSPEAVKRARAAAGRPGRRGPLPGRQGARRRPGQGRGRAAAEAADGPRRPGAGSSPPRRSASSASKDAAGRWWRC